MPRVVARATKGALFPGARRIGAERKLRASALRATRPFVGCPSLPDVGSIGGKRVLRRSSDSRRAAILPPANGSRGKEGLREASDRRRGIVLWACFAEMGKRYTLCRQRPNLRSVSLAGNRARATASSSATEITATSGVTADRNASVELVLLP